MPAIAATISTSPNASTAGPWTARSGLYVDSLSLRVFPQVSEATVSQDYGYLMQDGYGQEVAPVDLRGLFVRIVVSDGTTTKAWYGYCPSGTDTVRKTHENPGSHSGTVPSGRLQWSVVGWEHFLRSMTLQGVYVPTGFLRRVLPFNIRQGKRGGALLGNRAAATDDGAIIAALSGHYRFDPTSTAEWTAKTAIEHVLAVATVDTGVAWALSGQTTSLNLVTGAWDVGDAPSYADAIRAIANPEFGWAMIVNGPDVSIGSISDVSIGDLPANPNVVTLDVENTGSMDAPRVSFLDQAHYSTITVRGEPLRVMFTLSVADGNLEADWDATDEAAYMAETTDAGRRQDAYRYVWSRFRIPEAWAGTVGAIGGGTRAAFPTIDPADGSPVAATGQAVWARDVVFDRTTPPLDAANDEQPGHPIVFGDNAGGGPFRIDDPPDDSQTVSPSGARAVSCCDDRPGIQLTLPYRHFLAWNLTPAYSGGGKLPVYEWASLVATVSAYTNERVRITRNAVDAEPGAIAREKVIDIPGLHLWMVLAGTQTDVDTYEIADRILRDDRPTLVRCANLARAWYGRARASIAVNYRDPGVLDRLGQVISEVRTTGAIVPAGTMVTQVNYTFTSPQSVSFQTELFDLDFARMFSSGARVRQHHAELQHVRAELANIPARFCSTSEWPAVPSNTGTYVARVVNGVYCWVQVKTCDGTTPTATPTTAGPTPTPG